MEQGAKHVTPDQTWSKGIDAARLRQGELTADKIRQVRAVIQELLTDPKVPPNHINANRVSRRKDTPSHEFLAQHSGDNASRRGLSHDLLREIADAREAKRKQLRAAGGDAQRKRETEFSGLHAQLKTYRTRLDTLHQQLETERTKTAETERRLKVALGAHVDRWADIDPAQRAKERAHNENLRSQVFDLSSERATLEKANREAIERIRALEDTNRQLGDDLLSCTCRQGVTRLNPRLPQHQS